MHHHSVHDMCNIWEDPSDFVIPLVLRSHFKHIEHKLVMNKSDLNIQNAQADQHRQSISHLLPQNTVVVHDMCPR